MKDLLLQSVRKFLERREVGGKRLLLGYSGGPDSKALLHLLQACRRPLDFELHLAHVDHGWRKQSQQEAEDIRREAEGLGLALHLQTIDLQNFSTGNWEKQGRDFRLRFFCDVYARIGCHALLLGHHADDQAETVLKRVFEGAPIASMGGLASESFLIGMSVWRPLLAFRKKRILEWLSQNNMGCFFDPTNLDKRFLRGKMRTEMLPALSECFGKEISLSLCRLGEESREIQIHFSTLNRPLLKQIKKSNRQESLDLNPFLPIPQLQIKFLLREWLGGGKAVFSRQIYDQVAELLTKQAQERKFLSGSGMILVEKGVVHFFEG